tara:strand:+ start:239 stop:469 length:231 start_codon:yes stop_codon:yes gene_type:complete
MEHQQALMCVLLHVVTIVNKINKINNNKEDNKKADLPVRVMPHSPVPHRPAQRSGLLDHSAKSHKLHLEQLLHAGD